MKRNSKLCIISLVHNRPNYIERSFESLYKRAGMSFVHYVFDDNSNNETKKKLRDLKKKYKFKLKVDSIGELGTYKRFYLAYNQLPKTYDYYVKLDSDIEVLSDDFFSQLLLVFKYNKKKDKAISGIVPRVEGVKGFDRYTVRPDFYGGHAMKVTNLIVTGCCMIFPGKVFNSLEPKSTKDILKLEEKWGIDSVLLNNALKYGNFSIVDDLSVYHIDNAYGQRRIDPEYFINRKRWDKIDNDEVWYMIASKELYPKFLSREEYETIIKRSSSLEDFIEKCKYFFDTKGIIKEEKLEAKQDLTIIKKNSIIKTMPTVEMYKITSPKNFKPCEQIPHGESRFFNEVPEWAKNNPRVVVEISKVFVSKMPSQTIVKTDITEIKEKEKTVKKMKRCKICDFQSQSNKVLKTHMKKKHPDGE